VNRGLVFATLLVACGDNKQLEPFVRCERPISGGTVEMRKIAQISNPAMLVTSPPRDYRLFVVDQTGAIHIIEDGVLLPEPFLDLSDAANGPVICCGENGLLGLAFHPNYAVNRLFFITYTATLVGDPSNGQRDVLARCTATESDPNKADPASCVDVMSIPDFARNHNGGMIEVGADGYLYWATGDGGGRNDPNGNGQAIEDVPETNTNALLGKMLRLDIDHKAPGREYSIPDDNPFAHGGGKPEIFVIGLRNPWRWSFDRGTGDMWIADVGQFRIEEITVLRPHQQRAANLGWSTWEGSLCNVEASLCVTPQVVPQDERLHSDGWTSISGGQVYRGACFPDLQGTYFYTDYDDVGRLSTARLRDDDTLEIVDLPGTYPPYGASIHADAAGELYESDTSGNIYQLFVVGP
jgi:glucose/arabinose dehydrogenase